MIDVEYLIPLITYLDMVIVYNNIFYISTCRVSDTSDNVFRHGDRGTTTLFTYQPVEYLIPLITYLDMVIVVQQHYLHINL